MLQPRLQVGARIVTTAESQCFNHTKCAGSQCCNEHSGERAEVAQRRGHNVATTLAGGRENCNDGEITMLQPY